MSAMLKLIVGGTIGGIVGYFVSGLIIYKLDQLEVNEEDLIEKIDEIVTTNEEKVEEKEAKRIINYNKYGDGKKASVLEQYETSIGDTPVKESSPDLPVLISEEDCKPLGKETLLYYEVDDRLTRQDESLVEKPEDLIGPDALVSFGRENDPDVVYVWNPVLETQFEVIRINKSYEAEVLGIRPEDPKKKVTKKNGKSNPQESD